MKRAVAVAVGPVLALAGACSLTTDLDGLSGGPGDGGSSPSEGGAPRDANGSDAADGEAPRTDAGREGGPPAICPDKPVALCEDFDADEKKNGWTITQAGGASIGVSTTPWGEPGLVVTTPKATRGAIPTAYWEKKIEKTVSKVSFDIDVQFDQYPTNTGEYHNTFAVRLDHGATYNILYWSINAGVTGWAVQDFPSHPDNIDYRVVPVSPNQRHRLHFDVEPGGRSRFAIDGTVVEDNPTPAYVLAGQPTVSVGISVSDVPATPMSMGFGHLVFTGE